MQIFESENPLIWGELDLPLLGLSEDWYGTKCSEPSTFSLAKDSESLWFIGIFPNSANIHPNSSPGQFTPELWKYDVAELFLASPSTGEYLEFNLTSNGAWWACKFTSVRQTTPEQPTFIAHIRSHQDHAGTDQSVVGLQISLNFLKKEIDFGVSTTANITMIRDSPSQRFLSASKLPGAHPDFHQPKSFSILLPTPVYPH